MNTRDILKPLTIGAALAFALITLATLVIQIPILLVAVITDLGERVVTAGLVAAAGVVADGTRETPPMPTGYRTRDMAAWSTP